MNPNTPDHSNSWAERLFRVILRLYPERFRQEYGAEMQQVMREMIDDPSIGRGQIYSYLLRDLPGSLLPEYLASARTGELKLKPYAYGILLGLPLCLAVVATNIVNPSFDYFGLNETVALALSGAILLGCFMLSGYLASGRAGKIGAGARVGALTALISIGIVMLTFVVIDNVFLDIVSKQPDKLLGFRQSQMTSMRDYINAGHLRGATIVLPLFALLGVVCGGAGALLRRLQPRGPLHSESLNLL